MENNLINQLEDFLKAVSSAKDSLKSLDLKKCLELFIKHKKLNARAGTIRYYETNLINVISYLNSINIYNSHEVTNEIILELTNHYLERKNCANSINKRITCLIYMLSFLAELKYISKNNLVFKPIKIQQVRISMIADNDLFKLLEHVKILKLKHQVIIYLLISTGIRLNELCNIKISNIDLSNDRIFLDFTKTKVSRYIYINSLFKPVLINYLESISKEGNYLLTNSDLPLNPSMVKSLIKRINKNINIKVSATRFRHLFATTLLSDSANIKLVQILLGHQNIKTTSRYLDYLDESLASVCETCNPLNKK